MDSGLSHRIRTSRSAEVCRLCLKKRYLVDINGNQYLRMQLLECFPHCTPDDSELPHFVCGECYQLIEITYQFSVRTRRTEVLLRSYVHMGGDFPEPETLEAEYRRTSKRSASPEKQEEEKQPHKKSRSSGKSSSRSTEKKERKSSKHKDNKERTSSKRTEKEGSSKHKDRKERTSSKHSEKNAECSSKRKEKESSTDNRSKRSSKKPSDSKLEQYYRSDEFLFGEVVELEPVEKRNDSIEDSQIAQRTETIADNLPGMSLKMSYNEMMNVLKTIENMQSNQLVSV